MVILDAFAGVGGNAIAFALRPEVQTVICVDLDRARLRMAANNCRVYNIPKDKVVFICADAVTVLECFENGKSTRKPPSSSSDQPVEQDGFSFGGLDLLPNKLDSIFLSPPWGGPDYIEKSCGRAGYDVNSIKINDIVNGEDLLRIAGKALTAEAKHISYFLPRNVDGISLVTSAVRAGFGGNMEMEEHWLNCKLKTVSAYFS
jgi:trimethylguanosine synthase